MCTVKVKKRKVLIVGKSSDYLDNLARQLESRSCEVTIVQESFEVFRKVAKERPNFVLIEVVLPKIDILSVCKIIKSNPTLRSIPIIVMSSVLGSNLEVIAQKAGADRLIQKSEDPNDLLLKLNGIIDDMEVNSSS